MKIIIMIEMISLNLNELHGLNNVRNFDETHIKRSNVQNNVIHDEITRKEKENS
jgi:hypothetical protein